MQPLVLGAATGYKPEQISLFVDSVKRSGFKGTTALLVDRSNFALQEYLTQNGMESVLIDSTPAWMPAWFARRRLSGGKMSYLQAAVARFADVIPASLIPAYAVHCAGPFHHIGNSRHFFYLEYLLANRPRFSHALITDTRDVVFQADPFENIPAECLWLFQECSNEKIGERRFNRVTVGKAYGEAGLTRIQNCGILCAGTTMGSTGMLIEYLRRMSKELIRLTPQIHGEFGFDQAVHNWFFWTGKMPGAEIKQNFYGPVATLMLERPDLLEYDDRDRLLNKDGKPAPVLHQYEYHASLVQHVMAQHART